MLQPGLPPQMQTDIEWATAHWTSRTNLRLIERREILGFTVDPDYIRFRVGSKSRSSSKLGRQGKMQDIEVGTSYDRFSLLHEIGHSVGLIHEHQRPDRDQHVIINMANVDKGRESDMKAISHLHVATNIYDPVSIMHYSRRGGSDSGKITLTPIPPATRLDGARQLTGLDIDIVNRVYDLAAFAPLDLPTVRAEVVDILAKTSGAPKADIKDTVKLGVGGLGLRPNSIGTLATDFEAIARRSNRYGAVSVSECRKLKTVKSCIALVLGRA